MRIHHARGGNQELAIKRETGLHFSRNLYTTTPSIMQTCSIGNRIAKSGFSAVDSSYSPTGSWRRSVARFEYVQAQQGVNNKGYGEGGENLNGDEGDQDIV